MYVVLGLPLCDTRDRFDIEREALSLSLSLYSIPGSQDFVPVSIVPPVDLPANKEARRSNLELITAVLSKRQHQRNKTARFQTPLSFLLAEPEVCGLAG